MILYNPTVSGSLLITGSLTTTGTLTAQTLVVQTITSSVDFVTGSSVNGSISSNTHQFTGSVLMSGSVGIGTNTPDYILTISGNTDPTSGIRIKNTDGASSAPRLIIEQANAQKMQMYAFTDSFVFNYNLTGGVAFYDGINNVNRLYISGSGNVGIGTTTPSEKLVIYGTASSRPRLLVGPITTSTLTYTTYNSQDNPAIEVNTSTTNGFAGLTMSNSNNTSGNTLGAITFAAAGTSNGEKRGAIIVSALEASAASSVSGNLIFYTAAASSVAERMRITSAGHIHIGDGFSNPAHRINLKVSQGTLVLTVSGYDTATNDTARFFSSSGTSGNGAATAMWLSRNDSTSRSINAGGTINASGADYAEYMTKSVNDAINKGDIVGVDINGKLTNIFADSISFVVKSTDPSYVGSDVWGNEEVIGKKPLKTEDQTEEEFAIINEVFEAKLEEARAKVDRIAFSGQVPCNVLGANVGDHIIPIQTEDGKITGQAITSPSFEQYQLSVGKVWKIMEDGRAWIAVKIG